MGFWNLKPMKKQVRTVKKRQKELTLEEAKARLGMKTTENRPKPVEKPREISGKADAAPKTPSNTRSEAVRDDSECEKDFLCTFRKLAQRHAKYDIWRDFVTMTACTFSNAGDRAHYDQREQLYLDTAKRYTKSELEEMAHMLACVILALEADPEQDFLGRIFTTLDLCDSNKGQVFTPYSVCQMMAEITMRQDSLVRDIEEGKGVISVNDPTCGSGATLISGINTAKRLLKDTPYNYQNHLLVVGQDIDFVVAMMCYIQISLLGVAGYVKVGNTLTEPICEGNDHDRYWYTPVYWSDVWVYRRAFQEMDVLTRKEYYDGQTEGEGSP